MLSTSIEDIDHFLRMLNSSFFGFLLISIQELFISEFLLFSSIYYHLLFEGDSLNLIIWRASTMASIWSRYENSNVKFISLLILFFKRIFTRSWTWNFIFISFTLNRKRIRKKTVSRTLIFYELSCSFKKE